MWSYGLLDGVQNSCTWHFYEDRKGSAGKNAFLGVFYFMSFSVTLGKTTHSRALTLSLLSVHACDLNNENPVFCLLAMLGYIRVAQEECLDHQPLSQRTSLHSGDGDGCYFEQCHLDGITRRGLRISRGVTAAERIERFDVLCHVRCQKRNRFPHSRCTHSTRGIILSVI